jgi:SAM-dependent methyltransferase
MRFSRLRWHWERLGRRDPFWAVLTDPDKRGRRWEIDEFFRSGILEIEAVLHHARELGLPVHRRRALDFGCGAGRLTQAMAAHFERCDGVDISTSMLRHARQLNRYPDRCIYHLNVSADLSRFADASFDFVYTTLVLQHMKPSYTRGYITELLRVLAPGGLLVFQLPSQRSTVEPPRDAQRSGAVGPLPAEAFRARLRIDTSIPPLDCGQQFPLDVSVENCSTVTWPCLPDRRGKYRVNVAHRWRLHDEVVFQLAARCPLEVDLSPGARTNAMLIVTAPTADGRYVLEIDMVQEDVSWFGERGAEALRIEVAVGTGISPPQAINPTPQPTPTFRVRHPHAYRVLRATRVRDLYWAYRRALDRIKLIRDAIIIFFQKRPEIPRLVAWWKSRPLKAAMAMYWIPRAEVLALISQAGGTVIEVEEEKTPGYLSCRYWVTKQN